MKTAEQLAARQVRLDARHDILTAANRHRIDPGFIPAYGMRHLQQAVFVVRQRRLVSDKTLELAGFNGQKAS